MGISPPIEVANLGMADSLILMVLALVVFGPRRLPQIGRQIGKLMYEFRKASNDFKFQMEEELRNSEEADRRKREEAERQRSLTLVPPPQPAASPDAESGTAAVVAPPASIASEGSGAEQDYSYETYADSAAAYESQPPAETPAPEASAAPAEPAAAADAASSPLQVRPPATGEPVPAARPGSAIDSVPPSVTTAAREPQVGLVPEPGAATEVNHHETEAAAEAHDAAVEPTAHHG